MSQNPLLLVTATRKEMQAALGSRVSGLALQPMRPESLSWQGRPLNLLVTGIGPVNAALGLGRALEARTSVAGVLNLGIAGSFDLKHVPIGSAVVVATEIWPEFGLHTEAGIDPRGLKLGHGRVDGRVVWERLELEPVQAAEGMGLYLDRKWQHVLSLSVAGVSGSLDRAACLRARTAAEVENMEGFALAWACVLAEVPFVQVRTISNQVGSREPKAWDLNLAFSRLGPVADRLLAGAKECLPGPRL